MNLRKNRTSVRVVCIKNLTLKLQFYHSISAGFPSPADDYLEEQLSLDEHLIKNPSATYFVEVEGHSMIRAGIHDKDILVVDRSLKARLGNIIVASLDGEFTVKRLVKRGKNYYLKAEHPDYPAILISKQSDFKVWGVVTFVVHKTKRQP